MIDVACGCGKRFRLGDEHAGKRIKCPGCGHPVAVEDRPPSLPAAAEVPFSRFEQAVLDRLDRQLALAEKVRLRVEWILVILALPFVLGGLWLAALVVAVLLGAKV